MIDWRTELLKIDSTLTDSQRRILKDGPKALSEAWVLGGLRRRYYILKDILKEDNTTDK